MNWWSLCLVLWGQRMEKEEGGVWAVRCCLGCKVWVMMNINLPVIPSLGRRWRS